MSKEQSAFGLNLAEKILTSGKALEKFKQIIKAQGGDFRIILSLIHI